MCEEEVSVQKLLRRLQEMTNWRDRKAIVGTIPVSTDVSLSCQLLQLRSSLWELWTFIFFKEKIPFIFKMTGNSLQEALLFFFFFFLVLYTPVVCVGKNIQAFCFVFFCLQLVCSVFCDGALVVVSLLCSLYPCHDQTFVPLCRSSPAGNMFPHKSNLPMKILW